MTGRGEREQILVIDQATDQSSISAVLDALPREHYAVMRARVSADVVEDVARLAPSVVLVDHDSVGASVIPICRDVHGKTRSRVVVIARTSVAEAEVVELLDAGADDVISGTTPDVLSARLRAASRSRERAPVRHVLALGDTEIDLDAHAVRIEGVLRRLAPLHFDLLVYLAERQGTIVTTDELMVRLWGADRSELTTRRLRIAVSWLRKALGEGIMRPKIETVHRIGYRLDVVTSSRTGDGRAATVA